MSVPTATTSRLYQPLSKEQLEIRLVTIVLEPSLDSLSSTIDCKLATFALADAPAYIALSYVWGDIKQTAPITLDETEIQVTTNLLAALRRLSNWGQGTYLWIDALCINQSNAEEKCHQVLLMRNIYQQAMFVTMWLGEAQDDSHLAMSKIDAWGKAYYNMEKDLDNKSKVAAALAIIDNPFEETSWKAIRKFLQRPYWKRIWIVQEIALSQQAIMICGGSAFESIYFWFAITFWEVVIQPEVLDMVTSDNKMTIVNCGHRSSLSLFHFHGQQAFERPVTPFALTLQQHLIGTRSHLATDPRDKVYALLGLVDGDYKEYTPDYNKSVVQVYTDVVVKHALATNTLSSYYFQGIGVSNENRVPDLPSWVPDLSNATDRGYRISTFLEPGDTGFTSAEDTTSKFDFSDNFKVLTARGTIVDEISDIEPIGYSSPSANHLIRWLEFAATVSQPFHLTGMPWRQAFLRTLIGDKSGYGYGKSDFRDDKLKEDFYEQAVGFLWFYGLEPGKDGVTLDDATRGCRSAEELIARIYELYPSKEIWYFVMLFLFCDGHLLGPILEARTVALRQSLLYEFCGQRGTKWYIDSFVSKFRAISQRQMRDVAFHQIHVLSAQRRLFVTKRGHIGVAPMGVEKGDRICVLLGCNVPLVIRPEGDFYLIIGDTYTYGMMNGEVMQDVRDGKLHYEDLKFR
jgi:hypothetical protein